jgi:Fic family protein
MRSFADLDRTIGRVPAEVVTGLSRIDVGRGSEALYRDQLPGLLTALADRARVASITASSAIEGVVVPDEARADRILAGRVPTLRTRSEQELAGYRDAQDFLYQTDWRPPNVGLLLHLHRLLFEHTDVHGGRFKSTDNLVVDRSPDGSVQVRFRPVTALDTEFSLVELIDRFRDASERARHHPVLLVGLFALDLLVIHPFDDGNGRVARALTSALLQEAGYTVTRYVSVEQLIAEDPDPYYEALLASTHGWHDDESDPWPWLAYFVRVLARAYRVFAQRAAAERSPGTKQDRVRSYVLDHAAPVFRMADVRRALPGISDQTIRLVLAKLQAEGVIQTDGTGRSAVWRR